MIVERVLYNIKDIDLEKLEVDFVDIEWYEVQKKILRKLSSNGIEVGIRNGEALKEGDVLWQEGNKVLRIPYCDCIVLKPQNMYEMGKTCYEI